MSDANEIAKMILANNRTNQKLATAVKNSANVQIQKIVIQQVNIISPEESRNSSLIRDIIKVVVYFIQELLFN